MSDQHDDANPEWTEADFANALPPEVLPPISLLHFPRPLRASNARPLPPISTVGRDAGDDLIGF